MPDSLGLMNLGVLIAPAVVLLALERYRNRPSAGTPLLQRLAWTLLFFGIAGPFISIFGNFSLLAIPVLTATVLMMVDRQRNSEHRALMQLFSAAAERGIPLSDAARAFGEENGTDTGLRARVFARFLDAGMSVSEAARAAWLRMSSGVRLALALSDKGGLLGVSLQPQLKDLGEFDNLLRKTINSAFHFYTLTLFWVILFSVISSFTWRRIFPVYEKVLSAYGESLPSISRVLQPMDSMISDNEYFVLQAAFLFLLFGAGFISLYAYIGWLWRDFPFLRRWFWRYDGAIILRALAGLARQGRSFPEGIALFAKLYPRWSVRKRLLRAQRRLSAGEEWTAALVGAGIIPAAEAAVLRAAERVGNGPWALEEMADQLLRRMLYRVQLLLQFLFPACALAGGVVTLFFALAYFLPLVKLIQVLA